MRVIGGISKGTKLFSPTGMSTRPTSDKIKESLFNILAAYLLDIDFLDLFSGSGAIGIEALSRGAISAVFVDHSTDACNTIKKNLLKTKFVDNSLVLKLDILRAIYRLNRLNKKFDIIFLDPPYIFDKLDDILYDIKKYSLLKDNGIIVIEHSSSAMNFTCDDFYLFKQKIYKTTTVSFLELPKEI